VTTLALLLATLVDWLKYAVGHSMLLCLYIDGRVLSKSGG
jgi:hypothetical protein